MLLTEERIKSPTRKKNPVASELLAFSTSTPGSTIEPASGTKTGGVLVPRTETDLTGSPVGKTEFSPNSTEKGMSLFAPGGITVNPTNDQVLITGWVGAAKSPRCGRWNPRAKSRPSGKTKPASSKNADA